MSAIAQTVSILHSDDLGTILRASSISSGVTSLKSDVANLALLLHLLQCAERLFKRGARIDAMELVEVDALQLQPAQAHLDALDQVSSAANIFGLGRPLASDAALGSDDQTRCG
jgi:hypothetical protein